MDRQASHLINVAIYTLRTKVLSADTDDTTRTYLDLATRILRMVSVKLSEQEGLLASLAEETEALILSAPTGLAARAVTSRAPPKASADSGNVSFEAADRQARLSLEALSNLIPGVIKQVADGEGDIEGAIAWLDGVLASQEQYYEAVDPDVRKGSQVAYRGGRIDDEILAPLGPVPPEASPERLTNYFRKTGGDPAVMVTKVDTVPGGFSKTTHLLTLEKGAIVGANGAVIRQDPLAPYNCKTIEEEYDLLRRLYDHGYPIAQPLMLETDRAILGSAFAVSRRVAGSCDVRSWSKSADSIEPFAQMLARSLAQLHAIPLADLGYDPEIADLSAGEHMRLEIARWQDLYERKRRRAYPMNTLMLSWLADNIPAHAFAKRASVIHGDVGFHNLMVEGNEITAILDWEYSHFGDPVEDMIYMKPFIEQIYDWDRFTNLYYEAGGGIITEEDIAFYSVWPGARNATSCVDAVSVVETALPNELKYIVSGYVLMPYVQIDGAKAVLQRMRATLA